MKDDVCALCQSRATRVLVHRAHDWEYFAPGERDLVECTSCGLARLQPRPSGSELQAAYPPDYHGYHSAAGHGAVYRALAFIRNRSKAGLYIRLIGEHGRILDVGCADGFFFDALARHGRWSFEGIEFKDEIAARGRAMGRTIHTGELGNVDLPAEGYDLVVMNHLLEHVHDPVGTVREAFRILRPGGYVAGETPSIASWDFSLFRGLWGGLHAPRHVHQFTPITLEAVLHSGGFCEVEVRQELNSCHWAQSVQNWLVARGVGRRRLHHGRLRIYSWLLPLFVPVNAAAVLWRRSGVISFVGRKSPGVPHVEGAGP